MRFTEDVKEALHRAFKQAARSHRGASAPPVADRQILLGALETRRPFSRLDSLLRELRIAPGPLKKALRAMPPLAAPTATSPVATPSSEAVVAYPEPLRPFLSRLLGAGSEGAALDMDALLRAVLTGNDDPAFRALLHQSGLTLERLSAAITAVAGRRIAGLPARSAYSGLYLLREIAEMALIVVVLLALIREGVGEPRLIPSPSMLPTLQIGDRILVEKLTRWVRPYQRGDILVFYPPEPLAVVPRDPLSVAMRITGISALLHNQPDDPVDRAFIKRLVGLPGDVLQVVPGQGVRINGALIPEPYVAERALECVNACRPIQIPAGRYFMMGDNRNDSKDSRFFGFEPTSRVVGRAVFRIWPLPRIGTL